MEKSVVVTIGEIRLTMEEAVRFYHARKAAWMRDLNENAYSESVVVWNAIARADKAAKRIPLRQPIVTPQLKLAQARIEAMLKEPVK